MDRKMTIISCILWIAGIAAFIIGLNVPGDTGKWLALIGQFAFLIGLGLQGILYLRRKKTTADEEKSEARKPDDEKPGNA